jgi:hypothetical protein
MPKISGKKSKHAPSTKNHTHPKKIKQTKTKAERRAKDDSRFPDLITVSSDGTGDDTLLMIRDGDLSDITENTVVAIYRRRKVGTIVVTRKMSRVL